MIKIRIKALVRHVTRGMCLGEIYASIFASQLLTLDVSAQRQEFITQQATISIYSVKMCSHAGYL